MTVKIEMGMPNCCTSCRFCYYIAFNHTWACCAHIDLKTMEEKEVLKDTRQSWCPLQEVKE